MSKKSTTQVKIARKSSHFRLEGLALGARVRGLRNEQGWTLEEAGLHMNMDPKHLWKLERAYEGLNVTLITLVRIAEAFGVPVQSLFAYRGEVREPPPRKKKGGIKSKSSLPFSYHDAPKPTEEFTHYIPQYDLSDLVSSHWRVKPLKPKTWIRLKDKTLMATDRFLSALPPHLSDMPDRARFGLFKNISSEEPLHQKRALISHPYVLDSMSTQKKFTDEMIQDQPYESSPDSSTLLTLSSSSMMSIREIHIDERENVVTLSSLNEGQEDLVLRGLDLLKIRVIALLIKTLD